jgi:hypothetical protein
MPCSARLLANKYDRVSVLLAELFLSMSLNCPLLLSAVASSVSTRSVSKREHALASGSAMASSET